MTIDEPGFHALFGPSGVGKSSLARIISDQLPVEKGTVHLNETGKPLYGFNMERLPGWSSVGHHLELVTPAHNKGLKNDLIQGFGLTSLLGRHFSQLSLGQQNRINLLRYLVQDFEALIMDEALANVDEQTRVHILLTIKSLFPNRLFVYISHNVIEVATLCRQIWVLRGIHRSPQIKMIRGLDRYPNEDENRDELNRVMLEIMNAA